MNNTATQIFKEAYEAKTGKVCDDLILENMAYAIEAMEVYKSKLHPPTITDSEIEQMAKAHSDDRDSQMSFKEGAKAVLSMMPQSEGWVKVEECDTMYCNCKHPTLGSSISRCGTCDNWFNPLPHPPKNK